MEAQTQSAVVFGSKSVHREQVKRRFRNFYNNKLSFYGALVFLAILLGSILVPLVSRYGYAEMNIALGSKAPSLAHLFGTDKLGRDLFVRCMVGGRYSILIGVAAAFSRTVIGVILGALAGYYGGKIDAFILRVAELFQTFPTLILVLIIKAMVGGGLGTLLVIFSLTGWMSTTRLVRNEFLAIRNETYVRVSEAFGMKKATIMFKEILPNILTPIIVSATAAIPGYIMSEASLSYLGLGVPESTPTWGNIINTSASLGNIVNHWWLWFLPVAVLLLFVLSVNFMGDGLRDMLDPRQL